MFHCFAQFLIVPNVPDFPHHDLFFSADDRQEHLDLLSQSASKHALDFLAWCLMSNHAQFVLIPRHARALARTFGATHCDFPCRLAGNRWEERFHSYPMDEQKGLGSLVKSSSRSLFSPSTIFGQIRLTRRSVQSQAEFRLFLLDESSCPSAVKLIVSAITACVIKSAQARGGQ
jgi:hypothetical protein